jgi:hypothetical protein
MRALVYFRGKGETTYRKLGLQEMKALPPKGGDVTVDVDGKRTQARVMDRREFVSRWRKTPRDLSLYLEGIQPMKDPPARSRVSAARTSDPETTPTRTIRLGGLLSRFPFGRRRGLR